LGCRLLDLLSNRPDTAWQRLFGSETYCSDLLREELGWRPQQSLETALQLDRGAA
jgi:hypothetical protein